ncbi:MAG: hypothetical protein JNK33_03505 [Candidatus Doudnabacteria bacterium]|nr:hypothetical protein [Candidatus Doudnabacteria bacterium]
MNSLENKKILVLYTAHTLGHQRIAENIGYWLTQSHAQVELREVLKSNPSPAVHYFLKVHVWVNTHAPWFWKFLYLWGFWVTMMPLRLPVAWFQRVEIEKCIADFSPDVVITTQTSPSAVVSMLKRANIYTGLWGIAFSDYHFHRGWVYPRTDFYLTNIESQVEQLKRLGVQPQNIFRVGFALPPVVVPAAVQVKERLGIPLSAKVLLVGSGSLGVRLPTGLLAVCDQVVATLRAKEIECRVVVACGRSAEVLEELRDAQKQRAWLVPLSFYSPMVELYAAADLFMTKPGGLSVAEAGQIGLPMVVTHTLPGQEDLNLLYLEGRGYVTSLVHVPQGQWASRIAELVLGGQSLQPDPQEFRDVLAPQSLNTLGQFVAGCFIKISHG